MSDSESEAEATYEERLEDLSNDLDNFINDFPDDPTRETENELVNILKEVIAVVREAEAANDDGLQALIEQADRILDQGVVFGYGEDEDIGLFSGSHMPSFAHDEVKSPLLKDVSADGKFSHGFIGKITPFLGELLSILGSDRSIEEVTSRSNFAEPWKKTRRPHPLSTPCSRFKESLPEWTATEANTRATAVFEARCEISSGDIRSPIDMAVSSNGNLLALSSMGGWKNRTPYLSYYLPNHEHDDLGEFMKSHTIKVDLFSVLDQFMVDEEWKLMFAADWARIKSYKWTEPAQGQKFVKALRVHTMESKAYTGPLAMLPNSRLIRAGKGTVGVWELDSLATHGPTGTDIVGSKIDSKKMDTWRDDPESIEPSTGSTVSTTIGLDGEKMDEGEGLEISKWSRHPSQENVMLCGFSTRKGQYYYCHGFDLEAGGKLTTRYLGHGGSVDGFSTSVKADPNVFLTWCSDGHARLYDVRHPLPVVTIAASGHPEPMPAAVLAHPDGIPFVFTGAAQSESIRLWDVRARAVIYELATGNNAVEAMAWDETSNSLYAATSCPHIDWNGRHLDYRQARIPKERVRDEEGDGEGGEDDREDGGDDIEELSDDMCWPKGAHHAEDHFGHVFDAGDHRLYKFKFKMDPDPNQLPYYGSASLGTGFW